MKTRLALAENRITRGNRKAMRNRENRKHKEEIHSSSILHGQNVERRGRRGRRDWPGIRTGR